MSRWYWMCRHVCLGTVLVAGAFALAAALAGPAFAAKPSSHGGGGGHTGGGGGGGGHSGGGSSSTTGYDISYPQCTSSLPTGQAFGIVGVNDGLANNFNPCLGTELSWALSSPGLTSPFQPAASLYINTADPGPIVTDWPTTGSAPSSLGYGNCTGGWTTACAYVYGTLLAGNSYQSVKSLNSTVASTAPWWLDIETANSWATSSTSGYTALNIAAIQGFIGGLTGAGATGPIGVYSTASQWSSITGLTSSTTGGYFGNLPAWVPGARTLKQATSNCATTSFTGQAPTLAQYSANGFDADLRCG